MAPRLPADTTLGPVALTVADLERSLAYWRDEIGLEVQDRADGRATLGVPGTALLELEEVPGAPPADGYSGLFHVALLVPERADLARWLAHAARDGVRLTGASDHDVSEALYLRDPDHHGIEIYADRPRSLWEGEVGQRLTTGPLDVDALLGVLDDPATAPFDGLPAGTRIGHVHLRVADVPDAIALLPRPARLRPHGVARRRRRRSWPPAATTTTSARTRGRAAAARRRRRDRRRCAAPPSCCRPRRSATPPSSGCGPAARRSRRATTGRSCATRRATPSVLVAA